MGTAAASGMPNNGRSRKKIHERKALVEAYVDKYRMMNAGKFPTVRNIIEHVGGGFYRVKAILQELEYNSKLPTVATAAKNSTITKTTQVCGTFDAGVSRDTPDCQVSHKRTAVVDEYVISAECYSNYGGDKNNAQKMIDMSTLNTNHEITAKYVSGSVRKVDLELGVESDRISADIDMSDNNGFLGSHLVPVVSGLVEDSSANDTRMAMAMDDYESPAKPGHPSEVSGTCTNPTPKKIDEASGQAFESVELTRVTHVGKFSTVIGNKKQVGVSDSATIEGLDISMVGGEVNKTFETEKSLNCEVKVGSTATVDDSRVSAGKEFSIQMKVDNDTCQKMIDTPTLIHSKDLTAEDVCRSEKTISMSVKAIATEDCEVFVKPSHPSEIPKILQNTEIIEIDEASTQASNCDKNSRVMATQKTYDKEVQKLSLWGSLKSLASNFMSKLLKT